MARHATSAGYLPPGVPGQPEVQIVIDLGADVFDDQRTDKVRRVGSEAVRIDASRERRSTLYQ
ncbi:hypothetical protein ABT124_39550 [Streptomyces sp. NPDC001982]|uniref:hypothetical protein n=1 Tax=unclassified Streptomyces TaxID=2593676 RepID=UPI00331FB2F7